MNNLRGIVKAVIYLGDRSKTIRSNFCKMFFFFQESVDVIEKWNVQNDRWSDKENGETNE